MVIERGRFDRSMGAGSSVIRRCVCSQLCIWKQSYPNPAAFGIDYGCDWCRDADAVPGDGELGTRLPAGMDDKQDLFFGAAGARADKAAGRSGEIVDSAVWKAFGKAEFFTLQPALCSDRLCRPRNRRFGSVQCHFAGRGSFSGTGAVFGWTGSRLRRCDGRCKRSGSRGRHPGDQRPGNFSRGMARQPCCGKAALPGILAWWCYSDCDCCFKIVLTCTGYKNGKGQVFCSRRQLWKFVALVNTRKSV